MHTFCNRNLHENRSRLFDIHREERVLFARKREHVCRLWTWIVMQDIPLHQLNSRVWYKAVLCDMILFSSQHSLNCMSACIVVYINCTFIVAGGIYCVFWSLPKQSSKPNLYLSFFLSFLLTLPLYYYMSTVAMETILLFLSSLLVCVAGKLHCTHMHTNNTNSP